METGSEGEVTNNDFPLRKTGNLTVKNEHFVFVY